MMSNTSGLAVGGGASLVGAVVQGVESAANGVAHFLDALASSVQAAKELERLSAMSDGALAAKGLSRDKIAKHVIDSYLTF